MNVRDIEEINKVLKRNKELFVKKRTPQFKNEITQLIVSYKKVEYQETLKQLDNIKVSKEQMHEKTVQLKENLDHIRGQKDSYAEELTMSKGDLKNNLADVEAENHELDELIS